MDFCVILLEPGSKSNNDGLKQIPYLEDPTQTNLIEVLSFWPSPVNKVAVFHNNEQNVIETFL